MTANKSGHSAQTKRSCDREKFVLLYMPNGLPIDCPSSLKDLVFGRQVPLQLEGPPLIGQTISNYRILEKLGNGVGDGAAYRSTHLR